MMRGIGINLLAVSSSSPLDNIISVADAAALPGAGDTVGRVFYYTQDTRSWYFWNGSAWVLILDDADHADLQTVIAGLAAHIADGTDAHDASAISVVPSGSLAADDVQDALLEILGDIEAHVADAADAHDASAISYDPAGNIVLTGITVQAALDQADAELDSIADDLADHLADAADAHDASAISVVPTGNLAADDVQEALQELQGDIDTINNRGYSAAVNSAVADASTPNFTGTPRRVQRISGSGGPVTLADLAVTSAEEGDELVLIGTSSANTVTIVSATNTVVNGSCTLALDDMVTFLFIDAQWKEQSRSA